MNRFLRRLIIFGLPMYIVVLLYIVIDPFKVLRDYDTYIELDKNYQVTTNRDFYSTEQFLKNYKKYSYDSFIFGNSRSIFYKVEDLDDFIDGSFFHFNALGETIYGIAGKFQFLEEQNIEIKNALIIIDYSTLKGIANSQGHRFIKHPGISGESPLSFHLEMFRGFASRAMTAHVELFFTKRKRKYMEQYGIRDPVWKYNEITNQLSYFVFDKQIETSPDSYYQSRKDLFYSRDTGERFSPPVIFDKQKLFLEQIKALLRLHHASYKIIISPLYDQKKLDKMDLRHLESVFGADNVFDFSGINDITSDYRNYYEAAHYRPSVARRMMRLVYEEGRTAYNNMYNRRR